MNAPDKLDLETAEKLLDAVFGVIIGISLPALPEAIGEFCADHSISQLTRALLLGSALFYGAFYWLETRHFIRKQHEFNTEIGKVDAQNRDGVPLPLASFLMGILVLMAFASAQLKFAADGSFLRFSYAAGLFWLCDLGGTFLLKREYRKKENLLDLRDSVSSEGERWYVGHIASPFFYYYGVGNLLPFACGVLIVQFCHVPTYGEAILAGVYFVLTVVRHLCVRSNVLERVTDRWEQRLARG